jgi:hypothetical protein
MNSKPTRRRVSVRVGEYRAWDLRIGLEFSLPLRPEKTNESSSPARPRTATPAPETNHRWWRSSSLAPASLSPSFSPLISLHIPVGNTLHPLSSSPNPSRRWKMATGWWPGDGMGAEVRRLSSRPSSSFEWARWRWIVGRRRWPDEASIGAS